MSDLQNPTFIPPAPDGSQPPEIIPPSPLSPVPVEDPSWGIWEIVGIIVVGPATLFFFVIIVMLLAHRFLYPRESMVEGCNNILCC